MTDRFLVFPGSGQRAEDVTGEMAESIKTPIHGYAENRSITLAAALGVLAIVQQELIDDHR